MNANTRWGLITAGCVIVAAVGTWFVAKRGAPAPEAAPAQAAEVKKDETVKLLVAYSKPLMLTYTHQADPDALTKLLFESELKTPKGKRIEIERIGLNSREMIDGVLNGSLKAHVIVPSSEVFLELGEKESKLKTGKPLLYDKEKVVFMQQPHVIAVRRPMAEAMGWPNKDLGWTDVLKIAREGWKAVGKDQWGPLKMVIGNPNLTDTGVHAAVSACFAALGNPKGLRDEDFQNPALLDAMKALDASVVWYPSSIEDFVRNEVTGVPPQCHMAALPEHLLRTLNDRSIRRKTAPEWVGIYPAKGAMVDNITAAVVQREWVSDEQREAAAMALKLLRSPEVQKRILAHGHRPAVAGLPVADSINEAMGADPKRPQESFDLPPVEVVVDCAAAWTNAWKTKQASAGGGTAPVTTPVSATTSAPLSMKRYTSLSPTVQCVQRARPCTVTIRDHKTKNVRGTGVIVDPRGFAVTNHHVVGKDKEVKVTFIGADDKYFEGTVLWSDPSQDLAIVRVHGIGKFPTTVFNDSDREVGETVIAIGNPLGYTGTVTVGIVSALEREIESPSGHKLNKLIQTDAGINPGNSGGPLLDIEGQLVGIVFAVHGGAQNIAFAIPLHRVREAIKQHVRE